MIESTKFPKSVVQILLKDDVSPQLKLEAVRYIEIFGNPTLSIFRAPQRGKAFCLTVNSSDEFAFVGDNSNYMVQSNQPQPLTSVKHGLVVQSDQPQPLISIKYPMVQSDQPQPLKHGLAVHVFAFSPKENELFGIGVLDQKDVIFTLKKKGVRGTILWEWNDQDAILWERHDQYTVPWKRNHQDATLWERDVQDGSGNTDMQKRVPLLTFSRDGTQFLTSGIGHTVQLWEVSSSGNFQIIRELELTSSDDEKSRESTYSAAASFLQGKSEIVADTSDEKVVHQPLEDNSFQHSRESTSSTKVSFLQDTIEIVVSTTDGKVVRWPLEDISFQHGRESTCSTKTSLLQGKSKIVATITDGKVVHCSLEDLSFQHSRESFVYITKASFLQDKSEVVAATSDGRVVHWSLDINSPGSIDLEIPIKVSGLISSNNRKEIFVCSKDDASVKIFNIDTGKEVGCVWSLPYQSPVRALHLALSPSGTSLVCGFSDGFVRVWNWVSTTTEWRLCCEARVSTDKNPVTDVVFFSDGKRVGVCTGRKERVGETQPADALVYVLDAEGPWGAVKKSDFDNNKTQFDVLYDILNPTNKLPTYKT
ncbi:hypothetical protein VKT23_010250 [Stygiomarasmius scandens]|uniref:Serine-threonine kinase receptor-associated protein n=1 Tax=Marasmiellus scandens TaxID=2682957 RepID=A0ABR1JDA0_9AGAR